MTAIESRWWGFGVPGRFFFSGPRDDKMLWVPVSLPIRCSGIFSAKADPLSVGELLQAARGLRPCAQCHSLRTDKDAGENPYTAQAGLILNSQLQTGSGYKHHLAILPFSSWLSLLPPPFLPASFFLLPRLQPSSGDDRATCLAWKIEANRWELSQLATAKYAQPPTSSTSGLSCWSLE